MKFEEFKELDSINAYAEFMSVKDAKASGHIPPEYEDIFRDDCICGSDRMINTRLTTVMCVDPKCYIKMGYNLDNMLKKFGCKGLGPSTCVSICKFGKENGIFKVPSHIEILHSFQRFEHLLGAKYQDLRHAVGTIQSTPLKFYQMIQYLCIPDYDTSCKDLFGDVSNFDDLMNKINSSSVIDFLYHRGVKDTKKAIHLYLSLRDIRAFELMFVGEYTKPAIKHVNICITGVVAPEGVSMTRKEFLNYCNSISVIDGTPLFDITANSAKMSNSYVIADHPSGSDKYSKAVYRERANPGVKIIYTSTEFVELIKSEVEKCRDLLSTKTIWT